MLHSDNYSPEEFNFVGQFLGFENHDEKLKYVRLRVLSEEISIKIPKAMRLTGELSFQVGESIQVMGMSKCDRHTRELKLKAIQILPFIEHCTQTLSAIPSRSVGAVSHDAKAKIKPKVKVLVCQKSGCLKRGGKGLCEALDQILRERNLEQDVKIERSGCVKRCSSAPSLVIMPGNHRYTEVRPKMLPQIVDAIAKNLVRH